MIYRPDNCIIDINKMSISHNALQVDIKKLLIHISHDYYRTN